MPAIWIISFVTFCNYVFTLSLYYFTPYATSILGATVTFGATLAAMKRWFSLFGNVGGGFFSDKFGTGNALLISFVVNGFGYLWEFYCCQQMQVLSCSLQFCLS